MSPALAARLRSPSPRLVDAAVALLVGGPVLIGAVVVGADRDRLGAAIVFGLAASLPLLVRRRWPFAVLGVIVAAAVLSPVDIAFQFPMMVALATIGANRSWEATIAAAGAVVATGFVYSVAGGPDFSIGDLIGTALLCAIASWLGLYVGSKRTSIEMLRERAERLDRERELLADAAVAEERVRIAQELHDVVAHNVSLIVVQAQALGATVPDPRVAQATDGIADLGRRTMAEMHRTLRLLRAPGDDAARREPQPGLADLDGLLDRSRAAGLSVELAVEGTPRPLPQSVDLSAFRIVQEALTNVLKHAGRARTRVRLSYGPEALEVTVVDSGEVPRNGARSAGGHGLIGMRERAALFGGTLTAGPHADDHGFEVRASLPYGGEPA